MAVDHRAGYAAIPKVAISAATVIANKFGWRDHNGPQGDGGEDAEADGQRRLSPPYQRRDDCHGDEDLRGVWCPGDRMRQP
jgi:hypothetical protein